MIMMRAWRLRSAEESGLGAASFCYADNNSGYFDSVTKFLGPLDIAVVGCGVAGRGRGDAARRDGPSRHGLREVRAAAAGRCRTAAAADGPRRRCASSASPTPRSRPARASPGSRRAPIAAARSSTCATPICIRSPSVSASRAPRCSTCCMAACSNRRPSWSPARRSSTSTRRISSRRAARAHGPFDLIVAADGAHSALRTRLMPHARAPIYPWGCIWTTAPDLAGIGAAGLLRQRVRGTS